MFQAIVHAPRLRSGARLCFSDLDQTPERAPTALAAGAEIALRFGACCPDHGLGAIVTLADGIAVLRVAQADWRLHRCPDASGPAVPGLVGEDWYVS